MAIQSKDGRLISYESEELIAEVREDIAEFGKDWIAFAVLQQIHGAPIITDYFLDEEDIHHPDAGIVSGEIAVRMTLSDLLEKLKRQDSVM